jgi:ParB family chromosome partitioning protein
MRLPEGKSRLDLVKAGLTGGLAKRGRLVVNLDRLIEDPQNERKTYRNMAGMIASVKASGVIEPITVTPEGEGFRILTGHRRARAARAAGVKEVEIIVREPEDELARRRKSIVSNVQREDVGPVEMAEALQSMLTEDPTVRSQADLARAIGKTEEWVSAMLRLLTLPAEAQEKVRTSQLSVSYDAMIRIARVKDRAEQAALLDAALQGISAHEIRRRIGEKREQGKATERITERVGHYSASVQGPAVRGANEKMRATVEALLQKLKLGGQ